MASAGVVRVELSDFAEEFLVAVADLVATIEHADRALLEDSIAEAAARLQDVLLGPI